jgi:hypothetical protein
VDAAGASNFLFRDSYVVYNKSAVSVNADNLSTKSASATDSNPDANQPYMRELTVDGGTPSVAYLSGNTPIALGQLYRAVWDVRLPSLSGLRFWAALSQYAGTAFETLLGSDAPNANYLGFRCSSNASDANWQFLASDGATQTLVDTGVPVSDKAFQLELRVDPTIPQVDVYVDGSPISSVTTHIAAGTTLLYANCGIVALSGTPVFRFANWRTMSRLPF